MSTVTDTSRDADAGAAAATSRWTSDRPLRRSVTAGRRRRLPHLLVGVLLVVACAAGVVVLSQQLGERRPVLVVTRPLTAGQVLTDSDLGQARVAADPGVAVIDAARRPAVLGRPVAVDVRPGSLLTEHALGEPEVPAAGEAVVALSVKPGRYPPRLAAGASVLVVPVARDSVGARDGEAVPPEGGWSAVVLDVSPGAQQQGAVLTLRLEDEHAREVAVLAEDSASVVLTAGGGR